ncbi:MAG: sporulation protein YqfD [Ruminococcus sp.]|nr:sporulation protein YqfD [Ruminococcus sp.]
MKNQIRGSVKINAEGKHIYKFINRIHHERICCFEQYVKSGVFYAEIYRHDLKKIRSIAEDYDIEIKSFEYDTLSSEVIRRRRRYGLIIGLVLVIATSLYFSGVIVTIDIQGNEKVSDSAILSALEEIDIKAGTPFGQINYVWSENQLRLMVNDIAWVGMHRTGHRLVVEVTEIVEKPEMLNERLPCNIVASHDAYISYTSVLDGQLMKKVGDYVLAGDMLVSGVTSDSTSHITLHHAMADITGVYKEEVTFESELKKQRLVPTGEKDTRRRLKLFSLDIPLYFGKNKYEYSENETIEKPLVIFGKRLPISITKEKFSELERTETILTEEEVSAELMKKVYLYEQNFLNECDILEREITHETNENTLTLTVNYKLEGNICEQKEIMIK